MSFRRILIVLSSARSVIRCLTAAGLFVLALVLLPSGSRAAEPSADQQPLPVPWAPADSLSTAGTASALSTEPHILPVPWEPSETLSTTETPTAAAPAAPEQKTIIDTLYRTISSEFLSSAVWVDSFFGDERYEAESNLSRFKLRYEVFRERGGKIEHRPDLDLRLSLPQMRKKTLLLVSGDPNDQPDLPSPLASSTTPGGAPTLAREQNLTTSLQYFVHETLEHSIAVRTGVRLHKGSPVVFIGPRYRYLTPLDSWTYRFTEEVLWASDVRWTSRSRVDLERKMPYDLFFRSTLEGLWQENTDGYAYAISFTLAQPLDPNRAFVYAWVNSFQTRPKDELEEELLLVRYRQRFWRPWLFFEIAPQCRFPRDRSFDATPGILFMLEMVFGQYKNYFF